VGDAPSLEPTDVCAPVVASADGAAEHLSEAGVESDVVVTDLDGAPEHAAEASRDGTIAVVHAHGDNPDAVGHWIREFDRQNVLGTTQTDPRLFGTLYNFGGFTDGDRTVFLADALGAKEIRLFGFDFEEADGKKRKKLRWAHTLLEHIEKKRGESLL